MVRPNLVDCGKRNYRMALVSSKGVRLAHTLVFGFQFVKNVRHSGSAYTDSLVQVAREEPGPPNPAPGLPGRLKVMSKFQKSLQ